jgi:transposase
MTKLPEVISTVRRRRSWSVEDKVAILDAAFRKGGSVAAAADTFGVSRALIYIWRTQVRNGLMPGVAMTDAGVSAFSAVAIVPEPRPPVSSPAASSTDTPCRERRRATIIEVRLVNGRTLKVDEGIAPDVLARVVAALDNDARRDGVDA